MRQILHGHDEAIKAWVISQIPEADDFGPSTAFGVVSDARLLAGFVFHDYHPDFRRIEITVAAASPMWARKEIMAGLFSYPFLQLNCYSVHAITPADYDLAVRTCHKAGMKRKTVLPHAFGPKRHGVVSQIVLPEFFNLYGAYLDGGQSAEVA